MPTVIKKKLYGIISELTGTIAENPMPQASNDDELAEKFADFLMDKISKIRETLKDYPSFKPQVKHVVVF